MQLTGGNTVLATANQVGAGQLILSDAQLGRLRQHLAVIHDEFAVLYTPAPGEPFAMEIEFKITSANILAIKQARPLVFQRASPPHARRSHHHRTLRHRGLGRCHHHRRLHNRIQGPPNLVHRR